MFCDRKLLNMGSAQEPKVAIFAFCGMGPRREIAGEDTIYRPDNISDSRFDRRVVNRNFDPLIIFQKMNMSGRGIREKVWRSPLRVRNRRGG